MRIIGNLAQPLDIAVVSRLIDRAGEFLVGLDFVGLVRKAVRMVEMDEFFPERSEFVLFVFAQLLPVGAGAQILDECLGQAKISLSIENRPTALAPSARHAPVRSPPHGSPPSFRDSRRCLPPVPRRG